MAFSRNASNQEHRLSMVDWVARAFELKANSLSVEVGAGQARESAIDYLQYLMTDDIGKPIVVDDFTRIFTSVWEDCLSQRRHLSLTAPPGLGKSSLARMLMLYSIGKLNHLRTCVISADKSDASNAVNLCRSIVLSPGYKNVFPGVEPDIERSMDAKGWKMGEWSLKTKLGQRKDPTMRAWAAQPKGEAIRVDMLLADDVVTQKTFEGAVHERIVKAFHSTWIEGRLANGGWCCYLQNVRGHHDLLHRLKTSPKFTSVWIGVTEDATEFFIKVWNPPKRMAIMEDPEAFGITKVDPEIENDPASFMGTFAFPPRPEWTKERMDSIERNAYLTMYRLKGLDPTGLLIPSWHKRTTIDTTAAGLIGVQEVDGLPLLGDLDRHRLIISAGFDIAGQHRRGMAFWILAKDRNGDVYPLEFWQIKGGLEEVISRIESAWQRGLRFTVLQVESNGVQTTILDAIRSLARRQSFEWQGRIVPFHTGSNKYDIQLGLPALDVEFQTGTIKWPGRMAQLGQRVGDTTTQHAVGEAWTLFETGIAHLTRDASRNTTPDGLMAFWFAHDGLRRTGFMSGNLKPRTIPIRRKELAL